MALRRHGSIYYAYFRDGYRQREVSLHVADYNTAIAMERELMTKLAVQRRQRRLQRTLDMLLHPTDTGSDASAKSDQILPPSRRSARLDRILESAEKFKTIGESAKKLWNVFLRWAKEKRLTPTDITPKLAMRFLDRAKSGKSYNNYRTAINSIWQAAAPELELPLSPFASLPSRLNNSRHQRPLTNSEFMRLYQSAPEPWKTASLIAWHTGARKKDVLELRWSDISGDVITFMPAKTRRFGRAVQIPMHPELVAALAKLPKVGDRVLEAFPLPNGSGTSDTAFKRILTNLGITDTTEGIVGFNSIRNSFITRLDKAGIPRHAIRGMVGQRSDDITDLYSHDLETARKITLLPSEVGEFTE